MAQMENVHKLVGKAITKYTKSRLVPLASWGITLSLFTTVAIEPVLAQSAMEESAEVVCSGTLGSAIFLASGTIALGLILGGVFQSALGFYKLSGGGGGMQRQSAGRNGLVNGALTLTGGLFLGSIGGVLNYLGVDISSCLNPDNILMAQPIAEAFITLV